MAVLLTIAARGGSKGVKNKNIRELCGKPLIAHSIDQAKRWAGAKRIVCSTDSPAIAEVAKAYGAQVPFMRPAEFATDTAGKIDVLRHAWLESERVFGERYDMLLDLDATAPIRKIEDIEGVYQLFLKSQADVVTTGTLARKSPYFNMLEEATDGYCYLSKKPQQPILRRQDAPKVYDLNASIYVYRREYLLDKKIRSSTQGRTLIWTMDDTSAFDIDREVDFLFVEYLVSKGVIIL
ncbi:MAG: acylneuraminate cytidylyltransferase family protein [Candidatus Omnitrophica bacterium]|nr:acylneuraminate cytidylyltransferase family protein [Candidatus Omnitrophota bacterium]